ncbi:MAG TPA: hypothetical protein PLR94_08150 [Accumulibacter sp.]|uniref:CIS tube protein n=1 Tax=Accumulibacter sp. TaxID=2053492 RepID=UPI00287B24AF|nr:hypothetical protein [Accumulibacter sp.]MDS4054747.1 hypothetical protein [Accumulibacter sp.]HMW80420.1 hypothetical protein [Accumulibacter sp.]HNB68828.1 hypothetical protein [Accumulibacter sp.]HNK03321.1 hypothetical protein [Accumulibacter sp.]
MAGPQIAHARLIPMNGDQVESDETKHIAVQFNPATLRLTLANTLHANSAGGSGGRRPAAQYVDKSESSLAVELVFDTTCEQPGAPANSDVRKLTGKIAEAFMKPLDPDSARPRAPQRCRFQWGSFMFTGMLASYGESLDFFAPEGIPLRATLALTFKEDRYQFDLDESVQAAARQQPSFAAGGGGQSAAQATQAAGGNPRQWRSVADLNQLENPRFTPDGGVLVPRSLFG